jgi:hypothetical protein
MLRNVRRLSAGIGEMIGEKRNHSFDIYMVVFFIEGNLTDGASLLRA